MTTIQENGLTLDYQGTLLLNSLLLETVTNYCLKLLDTSYPTITDTDTLGPRLGYNALGEGMVTVCTRSRFHHLHQGTNNITSARAASSDYHLK